MEKQQIDADQYHQRSHRMVSRINCKLETIIANPLKQSDVILCHVFLNLKQTQATFVTTTTIHITTTTKQVVVTTTSKIISDNNANNNKI